MRNKRETTARRHMMADAFVFVLLGVFALMSTFLIAVGAGAYRKAVDTTQLHARQRILTGYVANKVRMSEATGGVVISRSGQPTLRMACYADGESYVTSIYCYDGMLMEQFADAADEFDPESGEALCEAEYFNASLNGEGLYTFELGTAQGEVYTTCIAARCDI